MSLPIENLLNVLAGKTRRDARANASQRRRRGPRSSGHTLLATEPLETRSMLATFIAGFVPGGPIQVMSDDVANDAVTVLLQNNTVPVPGVPPTTIVAPTFSLLDQSGNLLSFGVQSIFPIVDPGTSAIYAAGVQVTGATNFSTTVKIVDLLTAVTNVTGNGSWVSLFSVTGQSGQIQVVNPSTMTVTTATPAVEIDGQFAATSPKKSSVQLSAPSIIVGKTTAVSADTVKLDTSTGAGTITLAGSVHATDGLTLVTNAPFDIANSVTSDNTLTLNVKAGATQTNGIVTAAAFSLSSSAGSVVLDGNNNLGTITSITAKDQDIVLNTTASVAQTGAIQARSLSLTADNGSVSLNNSGNKLDALAISAGGDISYTDADALQIGVAGGTLGLTAPGNNITVTTKNDLTQTTAGAIQAAQFAARLPTGAGGSRKIALGDAKNQVSTFLADTTSAGGTITFVNDSNFPLTVGDGVNAIIADTIAIKTQGAGSGTLTLASPLTTPTGAVTLTSGGAITQSAVAKITANALTVTNNASSGGIVLNTATGGNDVANVSIRNNSTGAAKGISFTGSNAGASGLTITGAGVTAAGGDIVIDSNGRSMYIAANIGTVGGNVTLTAANGINPEPFSQAGGISGNLLSVTNATGGRVQLDSALNAVTKLAINNNTVSGDVIYRDADGVDLSTGGIIAGGIIDLTVGGAFKAPAASGLTAGGAITVGATGVVTLDSSTTAGGQVSVTGSDVTVNSASPINGSSIALTAASAGVTIASAVTANQDVTIDGLTFVKLKTGASATATAGGVTITSTGGGFTA
ncbi:MAG: hypothetical protein WCF18_16385, partial [Chthoniobacteraceae bacterium]